MSPSHCRGIAEYLHRAAYNLTAWGFQDCARDPNNGAFGAALPKLLFRHLPRHYPANSVYGLFPFFTPPTTKLNLTNLKVVDKYDFNRPRPVPIPKVVDTIAGIRTVFNDSVTFKTTYPTMELLTEGYGFFLTFDSEKKQQWVFFVFALDEAVVDDRGGVGQAR